jgi:hypothetical protein
MITAIVHYPSREAVARKFRALPPVGAFLEMDDGLWIVNAVVFREASSTWGDARPTVYAVAVGIDRAVELQTAWNHWGSIPGKESA